MLTRPVNEEALIQRLLPARNADRGDRARAWTEWQSMVGEPVLARYVRGHNGTSEADEDILQDALLTAYLGLERGTYQPREGVPFTAYVVGIARNKIREARRRERHRADVDGEDEALDLPLNGAFLSGPLRSGPPQRQPEQRMERREQRDLLRSGISRLTGARRLVLEYYLSGASTGEIANRLSMSEALVRQHKCRGLRSLARDLGRAGGGATRSGGMAV